MPSSAIGKNEWTFNAEHLELRFYRENAVFMFKTTRVLHFFLHLFGELKKYAYLCNLNCVLRAYAQRVAHYINYINNV